MCVCQPRPWEDLPAGWIIPEAAPASPEKGHLPAAMPASDSRGSTAGDYRSPPGQPHTETNLAIACFPQEETWIHAQAATGRGSLAVTWHVGRQAPSRVPA